MRAVVCEPVYEWTNEGAVAQPPTPTTGAYMIPFLALASVSGGHTVLNILKGLFTSWQAKDWGTMVALIAIGGLLGLSVTMTITSDLGYVADAFT